MTIQHHISDELLLAYATGTLAEGWSIAIATHLALCPSCRRRLDFMEHAGGEMLEMVCNEEADDTSWEVMKARLGQARAPVAPLASPEIAAKPLAAAGGVTIPEPLRSYLGGDLASLKWKALGRGAYHIRIPTDDRETSVRLLKIPAGKPVPEHSHGGRELTLVLKGSFHDGEALFRRGDLEEADESLQHQPVATSEEDCICLAVTDAPLKFRSLLLRLVQPVLGI
ncbi:MULTISPECIES: ChrR family anti-sigma-E factor [Alphaproteobacteria]|uniref:Anti-sigma-E factor ChrR n=2 Tax=Alphaproteobacteria TaxID=28211 RepID=A0A512HIM4_9HYPH|nr:MULTISPECIES: ChrR family anti-sigma-E factor [Alphaproteobacteria]GEO85298.1 anti-sigma-E factor ChrR [Ciceribacter naphthalenivorans]GLR20937.1 anti-sigma-E factor ChrR [Ciceribacter naphthalenivorans]GLT03793.1 anti-sigma-E factor ChrR [Sphingomonas psychrolutea]